jgi:hypothetical protein
MDEPTLQPHLLGAVFALFGAPPPPADTPDADVLAALDYIAGRPAVIPEFWSDDVHAGDQGPAELEGA